MADLGQGAPTGGGAAGASPATESAPSKEPDKELLTRRSDRELYRMRTRYGIEIADKHYPMAGYGNFYAYVIYLGDNGYLDVYEVRDNWNGSGRVGYVDVQLDEKTAAQIRSELLSIKTFRDFRSLFDKLVQATYCNGEDGAYICEDDDDDDI